MKKIFFCTIMIAGLFMNCSDNEPETITSQWYIFAETQCANPWELGQWIPGSEVLDAVDIYLGDLGVEVLESSIDSSGIGEVCAACVCLSGRNIHVKADVNDEAVLLAEDFVPE